MKVLELIERCIKASGDLFMAWPDEPWVQDGAAVRVSLFGFDGGQEQMRTFRGQRVDSINADLSVRADVSQAKSLPENAGLAFQGPVKVGGFDIPGELARQWLSLPNPDPVSNADVLKPWVNGMDLTRRPSGKWIIDFDLRTEVEAGQYVAPMAYVQEKIKPERDQNKDDRRRTHWWQLGRAGTDLKRATAGLPRFIGFSRVAKHLLPVWLPAGTLPDSAVVVIAKSDDFTLGLLSSAIHGIWAHTQGTFMGVGNDLRYTPSSCFETFPFPQPTDVQRAEIEKWAKYVVQLRDHLLAQDDKATLTGIYNMVVGLREKPNSAHPVSALVTAHAHLDHAVAAAYGWEWPLTEDEVLARLLALNLERAAEAT